MGFSLADNLESIDCEKYLYAITGKKISQLTSDQVALLGMTTGAGVIVISAAAFAGGYTLATSGKIATVAKSLAVKGGEIVKVIFSSAGAAASEITKWSNIFGNIMAPVTSMFE